MSQKEGKIPGDDESRKYLSWIRPYVRHCGDERRPPWRLGERKLLDYLLVFIAEGEGGVQIDSEVYDAVEGDLFWIPPDTVHVMEGYPPSMVCPYVHFDLLYRSPISHWDFSIPEGMLDLSELAPLAHPPVDDPQIAALCGRIRGHTNLRVGGLIREICAEAARAQPFAQLRMSGLMTEIVAEILRGQTKPMEADREHLPMLEEAERYMAAHCAENLSVKELAGLAGLSVSHFRYLFGRCFGRPPREHLRRLRILRARQLMIGSDLTLSQIAVRCGFSTVHSFSRAFRAVEGMSPRAYRQYGTISTRVSGRTTPYVGSGGA